MNCVCNQKYFLAFMWSATVGLREKHSSLPFNKTQFAFYIGPKGVINDWRRFKLESMDQESLPAAKRELLRQMSSPSRPKDDARANINRKVYNQTGQRWWTFFSSISQRYNCFEAPWRHTIKPKTVVTTYLKTCRSFSGRGA